MDSTSPLPGSFVHITNYYHDASGGVRTNYDMLIREAERRGRRHSLIIPGEKTEVVQTGKFTRIYKIAARPSPLFDKRYRIMLPHQYLFHGSAIREALLTEKPDAIEIYDNYALTFLAGMTRKGYFRRLGRPMLLYFTGERFDTIFSSFVISGRVGKWFSHLVMGNFNLAMFDYFIANSPFVAEEIFDSVDIEKRGKVSKYLFRRCWEFFHNSPADFSNRVEICPRGVDISAFGPHLKTVENRAQICRELGISDSAFLLISSTRLSPEKNVKLLPEIVRWLHSNSDLDFHLIIAGDGPERPTLENECRNASPGRVSFAGHLSRQRLAEYYANADCFIHPNPREPFGNVGLEAMASGISVVVANSGGVLSYANHSNAWLADPTGEGFGKAIIKTASDSAEVESKRKAALATAAENNFEASFDRLFSTYDQMYRSFLQSSYAKETVSHTRELISQSVHTSTG